MSGEVRYRLGPLGLPDPSDPAAAVRSEAVRLFVDRARQVDTGFVLEDQAGSAVARLVRRLDGIPLGQQEDHDVRWRSGRRRGAGLGSGDGEPAGLPGSRVDPTGTWGFISNGSRVSEPGWSSFITTGPTTSAAAAWLAAAGSQRYAVHAFNTLERVALDWVAQLCGIPAACQGVFSSGGSTANLVALGAARQRAFERRGVDVSTDG